MKPDVQASVLTEMGVNCLFGGSLDDPLNLNPA